MENIFGKDKNDITKKLFLKLLPIQILIIAMSSINSIVNGAIAGQFIDSTTVGVVGLYFPMDSILNGIGTVLLAGTTVLCGRYMGKGDINKTNGVFSLNILSTFTIAALLTIISYLFTDALTVFLGSSAELKPALMTYIRGYAIGIIPQLLAQQLASFLQLERQNKRSYIGIAAMIISNFVCDIILVAILKLGIIGLALSTSISSVVYFVILGQYYLTSKAQLRFNYKQIDFKELPTLIKIGIPGAMLIICLSLRSLILNIIIIRYIGNDGLAAMSAFNMIGEILVVYCLGTGSVVRMLVSVYVGEQDRASIKHLLKVVFTRGLVITVILAALIILSSGLIARIFFPDVTSNAYAYMKQALVIYDFSLPLVLFCLTASNYLQALDHRVYVNVLSIVDGLFSMVIPSMILAPILGMLGIWLANPIGIFITAFMTPIYCIIYNKHIPRNIDEWLFFKEDFGVSEQDRLDFSISNIEDVTKTARLVEQFCKDHNLDSKTTYYAALCLEEMVGNVVEHGFKKDNGKHSVDVHVNYINGEIMLRIKDDCVPFNPKERASIVSGDDPLKNIGIKLVLKIAKDVNYVNLYGLNVLTIRI